MWSWKRKPRLINGHVVREVDKSCPVCKAPPTKWCEPGCKALDLMDYR